MRRRCAKGEATKPFFFQYLDDSRTATVSNAEVRGALENSSKLGEEMLGGLSNARQLQSNPWMFDSFFGSIAAGGHVKNATGYYVTGKDCRGHDSPGRRMHALWIQSF